MPSIHTSVYSPGLAQAGIRVVATAARERAAIEAVAEVVRQSCGESRVLPFVADVTKEDDSAVVADPSHATVIADLRKQLQDWRAATHDAWLAGITDPFGHAH